MTASHPSQRFSYDPPRAGEMSCRNPLDGGRGRDAHARRRVQLMRPARDQFQRDWSLLMIGSFASREACAVHFDVSFQTACNWFEGMCRPYGDHVEWARRSLPRYAEIMGDEA